MMIVGLAFFAFLIEGRQRVLAHLQRLPAPILSGV